LNRFGAAEKASGSRISVVAAVSAALRFAGDTPASTKFNLRFFNKANRLKNLGESLRCAVYLFDKKKSTPPLL
jgi:hypothetical protein